MILKKYIKTERIMSLIGKILLTYYLYFNIEKILNKTKMYFRYYVKLIPFVREKIKKSMLDFRIQLKKDLNRSINNKKMPIYDKIKNIGITDSGIINIINKNKNLKGFDWQNGMVSGTVYTNNTDLNNLMTKVYPIFARSNPLHPDIFPGVRKMEAEIIRMVANLFNSKSPGAGSFTTGGTESIILACKTYRDLSYKNNNYNPSILVCDTAHAAYWKAGHYLGIKIITVPHDKDCKLTVDNIVDYIEDNTIAIVASAPCFNFGIIDDIDNISKYCVNNGLYLHIDMCLGGFILPFIDKYKNISFDNEGITSISVDTHKYGCGPKGGSVILYKNQDLFKYQMFVKEDWSGGIYGTANITGSRSGNIISLTWASIMHIGFNLYKCYAKNISKITKKLFLAIEEIPELFAFGSPQICIVAIGSNKYSIYLICDKMKEKGWNLNVLQNPACFHLCITNCHTETHIIEFINDIKCCLKSIKTLTIANGNQIIESKSLYGSTQKINDGDIVTDLVKEYFCVLNELN